MERRTKGAQTAEEATERETSSVGLGSLLGQVTGRVLAILKPMRTGLTNNVPPLACETEPLARL